MSFLLNLYTATKTRITLCAIRIVTELRMVDHGTGSSKNERHEAMCVVNKKGLIESNTETSKVPMIVKRMIMDIVLTIGPIEFSANADKQIDKVEIVNNAR